MLGAAKQQQQQQQNKEDHQLHGGEWYKIGFKSRKVCQNRRVLILSLWGKTENKYHAIKKQKVMGEKSRAPE